MIVDIEDDRRYRLGFNPAAREFPYDAALYVAFDRLKRTDYPRYRRNAHRIQCAPRPRTMPSLPSALLSSLLSAPRHYGCAQPRTRRIKVARPTARGRADAVVGRAPRDVPRPRTQIRACRVSATPRCSRDPFIKCFAQPSRAEHKTVCGEMRSISLYLLVCVFL